MKIAEVLSRNFVDHMEGCQNQAVIKRFSGKTLLKIAGLESPSERQTVIDGYLTPSHLLAAIFRH